MADLSTNIKQAISDFDAIQQAMEEQGIPIPYDTDTATYGDKIRQNLLNKKDFYTKEEADILLDQKLNIGEETDPTVGVITNEDIFNMMRGVVR